MSKKSAKLDPRTLHECPQTMLLREKRKSQTGEGRFFTYPILTTVSDAYNVSHHDNCASDPFR